MTKDRYPYPPDEFDAVDPTSRPAGAHLAPPSAWSKVWPYLVVLIVAPAVGVGVIQLLSHYQSTPEGAATSSVTSTVTSSDLAGEGTDTSGATPTEATQPTDAQTTDAPPAETTPAETTPAVDYNARVICYNASHVAGMASRCADKLGAAGFADNQLADYDGTNRTPPSAVYYGDESFAATAQQVAAILGIATVEQNADEIGPADVAAVLRTDYKEN